MHSALAAALAAAAGHSTPAAAAATAAATVHAADMASGQRQRGGRRSRGNWSSVNSNNNNSPLLLLPRGALDTPTAHAIADALDGGGRGGVTAIAAPAPVADAAALAALVAACVRAGGGALELYLPGAAYLERLDLAPWAPDIAAARGRAARAQPQPQPFGLRGLCLDGAPLRELAPDGMHVLADLQWLSLKGTAIANLWTTAAALRPLTALTALSIAGHPQPFPSEHLDDLVAAAEDSGERQQGLLLQQQYQQHQQQIIPLTDNSSNMHSGSNSSNDQNDIDNRMVADSTVAQDAQKLAQANPTWTGQPLESTQSADTPHTSRHMSIDLVVSLVHMVQVHGYDPDGDARRHRLMQQGNALAEDRQQLAGSPDRGPATTPEDHVMNDVMPSNHQDLLVASNARQTPIAAQARYREFVISQPHLASLCMLDGIAISPQEVHRAQNVFDAHFQRFVCGQEALQSIIRLLHCRELGMTPFPQRKTRWNRHYSPSHPCPVHNLTQQTSYSEQDILGGSHCLVPSVHACCSGQRSPSFIPMHSAASRVQVQLKRPREPSCHSSALASPPSALESLPPSAGTAALNISLDRNQCPSSSLAQSFAHKTVHNADASGNASHDALAYYRRHNSMGLIDTTGDSSCAPRLGSKVITTPASLGVETAPASQHRIVPRCRYAGPPSSRAAKRPALLCSALDADDLLPSNAVDTQMAFVNHATPDTPPRGEFLPADMQSPILPSSSKAVRKAGGVSISFVGCGEFQERSLRNVMTAVVVDRPGHAFVDFLCEPHDRPRQFEYNPRSPGQLVYGTHNGDLVVIDQDRRRIIGSCQNGGGPCRRDPGQPFPQLGRADGHYDSQRRTSFHNLRRMFTRMESTEVESPVEEFSSAVLGLSWLNKSSAKFLAGTAAGSVHMYDVEWMNSGKKGGCVQACDDFGQLTSLHVNSEDDRFVVSGYTPHVGLFDLATGTRIEDMIDCHAEHINVIKFAHHSPHTLVTSSFDMYIKKWDLREARPGGARRPIFERRSNEGNVMVCFSPDDQYLLVSAVDNEVRQYRAGDGRLDRLFDIPKTHSRTNYTRSYYMNGRDYIITGSCREDVVRVYNSRTGQLLREVEMDSDRSAMVFVQSLRANPHRDFNLSVLLACNDTGSNETSIANRQMLANVDLLTRTSSEFAVS